MRRLGYAVIDALVDRQVGLRDGLPWRGGTRRELEPLLREPCPDDPGDPDAFAWLWAMVILWLVVRAAFGLVRIWPGVGEAPLAGRLPDGARPAQ